MVKRWALTLVSLLFCTSSFADGVSLGGGLSSRALQKVTDGISTCYPNQLTVSSGSLSCSGGNATISSGSGTVTSVATDATLTGGTITTTGTLGIATSAALPGSPTTTTQTQGDNSIKIATTSYVDSAVLAQNFKEACKYASTGALPTVVYSSGAGTLTGFAVGAISLDGSSPVVNDRILIKNQVSTFQNGIYSVTATGSGIAVFVLTRTADANTSTKFKTGDSVFITSGSTLSTTTWAYTGIDSPNFTSDAITYAQTAGQGSFTASNGVQITGTVISGVNAKADGSTKGVATFTATDFTDNGSGTISGVLSKVSTATPSSASSFTISGLSPGVRYKLIINMLQNTSDTTIKIRFNGDSGANYIWGTLIIAGGTPQGQNTSGDSSSQLSYGNQVATLPFQAEILFQSTQGNNNSVLYNSNLDEGNGSTAFLPAIGAGKYTGSTSLTSVTILVSSGTMTGTGSLYSMN